MVSVLFIGGLGRSGTTLLERLLGELPGVTPLGEVVHLWRRDVQHDERCACGRPFSRCPFWTAVGERAFGGWDALDLPRLLALQSAVDRTRFIPRLAATSLPPDWRAAVAEYVGHYERVYAAAAELSGARVVIDSSKNASLAYCLRWSDALDLKVLHLVRDARGVAYSWTKQVARPESDGDTMTRYSPTRSALLWDAHNAAFALLRRRGVAVRRLRYEKLLAAPGRTAASLARWLGVPAELGFLAGDGAALLGPCHSAAGNPMRFTTGPVELRRDDAWRTQLPPAQRRLVAAMTAPLLGRYGYPLAAGRG
ncbi:MAG TPA: sulfotransferase [Rugosimonospora sp.]|nr:sulfotransferase [Rugosimonospora sp.]